MRVIWMVLPCLLAIAGCDDGNSEQALCAGSCLAVSGTYSLSGTCAPTGCELSQTGCSISVRCNDGLAASGTASDGVSFQNADAKCRAELEGGALVGSCSYTAGGSCSFRAQPSQTLLCVDGTVPGTTASQGTSASTDVALATAVSNWCLELLPGECNEVFTDLQSCKQTVLSELSMRGYETATPMCQTMLKDLLTCWADLDGSVCSGALECNGDAYAVECGETGKGPDDDFFWSLVGD